jgi:hypothetical protein
MLGCLCLSDRIALLLGTEYVEDLCLSDRIILPLGFEYVERSLFVRRYSCTPRT